MDQGTGRDGAPVAALLTAGWQELFADRYPHAGGPEHTALFIENDEGFECEIVVDWLPLLSWNRRQQSALQAAATPIDDIDRP